MHEPNCTAPVSPSSADSAPPRVVVLPVEHLDVFQELSRGFAYGVGFAAGAGFFAAIAFLVRGSGASVE